MNKPFSIYDSPFSDETKKIRRNLLVASCACLFVGLSGEIPNNLIFIGYVMPNHQALIGWFMFAISTYLFIHFLSIACIEVAMWIHPFYTAILTKKSS